MLRLIGKMVLALAAAIVGVGLLLTCASLGLFFYKARVPDRMCVGGRVTDANGVPMKGVEVWAIPLAVWSHFSDDEKKTGAKEQKVASDKKGRFQFDDLIASGGGRDWTWVQKYDVVASAGGYASQKIRVQQNMRSKLISNTDLKMSDLVLEEKATVSGRIVDTRGHAVVGRAVRLALANKQDNSTLVWQKVLPSPVKTDAEGRFRFPDLSPGDYVVEVAAYPDYGLHVPQRAKNAPLTIAAGDEIAGVDFIVESPEDRGSIAGRVTDASDGKRIPRFSVTIAQMELAGGGSPVVGGCRAGGKFEPLRQLQVKEWEFGDFLIEDMSPATATLEIQAAGYGTERVRVNVESSRTVDVAVPLRSEGILTGIVTRNSKPCAHGYVQAWRVEEGPDVNVSTQTDGTGYYELTQLSPGDYRVRFSVWAGTAVQVQDVASTEVQAGKTTVLDVDLAGGSAAICGAFSASDRELEWRVDVYDATARDASLSKMERLRGCAWKIEEDRRYAIECLAPGTYEVVGKVSKKDKPRAAVMETSKTVTLGDGETAEVNFEFP